MISSLSRTAVEPQESFVELGPKRPFLARQRLPGEQFQYILRDETVHLAFGSDLVNAIVSENGEVWTESFRQKTVESVKRGVELEYIYAKDSLPRGVLGVNADMIHEYLRYIADRRLERINLPRVYNSKNPFPWLSEIMDLRKEKNFFETRVTEYKTGGQLQ